MAEPSGVDPEVARENVARSFRRRDEAELQSDLVALIERRTDLAAAQCHGLFWAAIGRLQERHGVTQLVPSATAIGAWVDAVVPPDPGSAISPVAGAVPYAPDPNAIALLTGPASEVVARGLLALAGRRPDLSDLQRHELFLAGLVHLVVRKAGFIIAPTRQGIFAWIDLVAPERIPSANTAGTGFVDHGPAGADDPAGQPRLLGPTATSSSEHAAAQLDASQRRAVAGWAGDPRVTSLVSTLRPMLRERLDQLGLEDPDKKAEAAVRMLGISPVLPDGIEVPNFFATWPEERLAPARFTALAIRAAVAQFVARLRDGHGVTAIAPVEKVPPDEGTPDGLRFRGDHTALLQLLWLDIRIEGRTGTEIAADIPVIGTVGWERDGSTLLLGLGDVTAPDILAGDILRRAFLQRVGATVDAARSDDASTLQPSQALCDYLEANPPGSADTYGRARADRYRTPGWSDLAEINYLAQTQERRQAGRPKSGRPPGSGWLIKDRAELLDMYRQLWQRASRRPSQGEFADVSGLSTRTVRRYLQRFGLRWPPE